jgi:hypothetical protein
MEYNNPQVGDLLLLKLSNNETMLAEVLEVGESPCNGQGYKLWFVLDTSGRPLIVGSGYWYGQNDLDSFIVSVHR